MTCRDSGIGACERELEGGEYCPGGLCLRYDYAEGETWWAAEMAELRRQGTFGYGPFICVGPTTPVQRTVRPHPTDASLVIVTDTYRGVCR